MKRKRKKRGKRKKRNRVCGKGASLQGMNRRLRDAHFDLVSDPRRDSHVRYKLPVILKAVVASCATGAESLRQVEQRTAGMAEGPGQSIVGHRIADNTIGGLLPRLDVQELVEALVRVTKAEERRKGLGAGEVGVGVVAIDGKHVATVWWPDLCRSVEVDDEEVKELEWECGAPSDKRGPTGKRTAEGLKETPKNIEWMRKKLAEEYPWVQLCVPSDGRVHGKIRVHTVTLVSSGPAVCIYLRPVEGATNEIGAMPHLVDELRNCYGRTTLFRYVTTDSGNTSVAVAGKIRQAGWHYFCQIKSNCGEIHSEAVRCLSGLGPDEAVQATYCDKQNGQVVVYYLWSVDLGQTGWLDWTHARQLIRVRRVCIEPKTGEVSSKGDRYYVTSASPQELDGHKALEMSRSHWRCENNTHWTNDAVLGEDRKRHMWSRHCNGLLVVAVLRSIALFILAMARYLSRTHYDNQMPSWKMVMAHFLASLCGSMLITEAFDAV